MAQNANLKQDELNVLADQVNAMSLEIQQQKDKLALNQTSLAKRIEPIAASDDVIKRLEAFREKHKVSPELFNTPEELLNAYKCSECGAEAAVGQASTAELER